MKNVLLITVLLTFLFSCASNKNQKPKRVCKKVEIEGITFDGQKAYSETCTTNTK